MSTSARKEGKSIAWRQVVWKSLTWLISFGCFYLVYQKIAAAAELKGQSAFEYLLEFFGEADWLMWLAVMIPYSIFFFLVDGHALWRSVRWFNVPTLRFQEILPIRASAFILALVNEQVGKGAMSLYLLKRHEVPGWKALSTMIFFAIVEVYQLLIFASAGLLARFDFVQDASTILPLNYILPAVFIVAALYFPLHIAYFRSYILPNSSLRDTTVLHALREARVWQYAVIALCKAPNLIGAVFVYTVALNLFEVNASTLQMLAFLPLIFLAASLPLPFHAGALVFWQLLFPDYPEVGAFSLVMHTFFVLFNAVLGLLFLPRANKELFG